MGRVKRKLNILVNFSADSHDTVWWSVHRCCVVQKRIKTKIKEVKKTLKFVFLARKKDDIRIVPGLCKKECRGRHVLAHQPQEWFLCEPCTSQSKFSRASRVSLRVPEWLSRNETSNRPCLYSFQEMFSRHCGWRNLSTCSGEQSPDTQKVLKVGKLEDVLVPSWEVS